MVTVAVGSGVKVGGGVGEYAATVCVNINEANSIALVPTTSTEGWVGVAGAQAVSKATITKMLKLKNRYFIGPLMFLYVIGISYLVKRPLGRGKHAPSRWHD